MRGGFAHCPMRQEVGEPAGAGKRRGWPRGGSGHRPQHGRSSWISTVIHDPARQVCESRLQRLRQQFSVLDTVDELFPSLSEEAEAEKLGVEDLNLRTRAELIALGASDDDLAGFDSLSPLSAYLVKYWAESKSLDVLVVLKEATAYSDRWNTRLSNYQHAMLYTIRRGKRGYRKYYSGWTTFTKLADVNIRYLLQLVHEALQAHLRSRPDALAAPVAAEVQTDAAGVIGRASCKAVAGCVG